MVKVVALWRNNFLFLSENMRFHRLFLAFSMLAFVACSNDGNSKIPDIPDDPDGAEVSYLSRDGSPVFIDDTGNGLSLNGNGCLHGENIYFTSSKRCDGLSYVTSIPLSDWRGNLSAVVGQGEGLVMGSRMFDGATFTRLFVDAVDNVTGEVVLKSQSPFYGDITSFYLHPKDRLILYKDAGNATVVLTKPTTYNVELASGRWASIRPHTTHVQVDYSENLTGKMRVDTLIFSNGRFADKRLPIVQFEYSLNDSID